ncbi:YkgJ family cysteine cluster protein [Myxococcota bacterium]|nr:YkgJ family cysteine cluster protein [Myxococcota bacterium]
MSPETALSEVLALHEEVDAWVAELVALHGPRLRCGRGCASCCQDELTVLEVEALRIRAAHAELLATAAPGPAGGCAFLDPQGGCRVYADRPYVCRTQGLPLRWLEEHEGDEWVEYRDICPLNEVGPPIEELELDACWSLGIFEPRLADLQEELQGGGEPRRVALRDLFGRRA